MTTSTSPFESWCRYFRQNLDAPEALHWSEPYRLSGAEALIAGPAIQQFQIGEWARGRGLKRRAASHPAFAGDSWFLPTLELFIAEEQGHSRMLGHFLDHERIPRLTVNWVDGIFRRLRKLAGLDVCVTVLVTAEVLAMPFYQALRDATGSPLLRSICSRILRDEAAHLSYQALTIGLIRGRLSTGLRTFRSMCHAALFGSTALLLWQQQRNVFRAAGWTFERFWTDARHWFQLLERRAGQAATCVRGQPAPGLATRP